MKQKTLKRSTGILAVILICILLFGGIFVPIVNSGMQTANAATKYRVIPSESEAVSEGIPSCQGRGK